jgi:hypothetical protein
MADVKIRVPLLEPLLVHVLSPTFSSHFRSLSSAEARICRIVFGNSVDPDVVLVGSTVVALPKQEDRPYTLGNRILIPTKASWDPPTMVHELTHVWQSQNCGNRYISDSASDQILKGNAAAYGIDGEEDIRAGQAFSNYEVEEQAMIVQGFYADLEARLKLRPGDEWSAVMANQSATSLDDLDRLANSEQMLLSDTRRSQPASTGNQTASRLQPLSASNTPWWYLFSSNQDVVRMISEVRKTVRLSASQQYERDFGGGPFDFNNSNPGSPVRTGGTVPILQIRWK